MLLCPGRPTITLSGLSALGAQKTFPSMSPTLIADLPVYIFIDMVVIGYFMRIANRSVASIVSL